jgi:hypothetical protein
MNKKDAMEELAHCTRMAKCHKAAASAHDSCLKAEGGDFHKDMRDAHMAAAQSYITKGEYCLKAAKSQPDDVGDNDLTSDESTHSREQGPRKVLTETERIDALRKSEMVQPTEVRGVLSDVPAGLQLVQRTGGPTPPSDLGRTAAEFRELFRE